MSRKEGPLAHVLHARHDSNGFTWEGSAMSDVLIVDDGCGNASRELAGRLKRAHHRVRNATSAEAAVGMMRRDKPDLVILPVPMLGRAAMPIVAELADAPAKDWPAVALWWSEPMPDPAGGPSRFGSCWFVASGEDWNKTHQRLMLVHESHESSRMKRGGD